MTAAAFVLALGSSASAQSEDGEQQRPEWLDGLDKAIDTVEQIDNWIKKQGELKKEQERLEREQQIERNQEADRNYVEALSDPNSVGRNLRRLDDLFRTDSFGTDLQNAATSLASLAGNPNLSDDDRSLSATLLGKVYLEMEPDQQRGVRVEVYTRSRDFEAGRGGDENKINPFNSFGRSLPNRGITEFAKHYFETDNPEMREFLVGEIASGGAHLERLSSPRLRYEMRTVDGKQETVRVDETSEESRQVAAVLLDSIYQNYENRGPAYWTAWRAFDQLGLSAREVIDAEIAQPREEAKSSWLQELAETSVAMKPYRGENREWSILDRTVFELARMREEEALRRLDRQIGGSPVEASADIDRDPARERERSDHLRTLHRRLDSRLSDLETQHPELAHSERLRMLREESISPQIADTEEMIGLLVSEVAEGQMEASRALLLYTRPENYQRVVDTLKDALRQNDVERQALRARFIAENQARWVEEGLTQSKIDLELRSFDRRQLFAPGNVARTIREILNEHDPSQVWDVMLDDSLPVEAREVILGDVYQDLIDPQTTTRESMGEPVNIRAAYEYAISPVPEEENFARTASTYRQELARVTGWAAAEYGAPDDMMDQVVGDLINTTDGRTPWMADEFLTIYKEEASPERIDHDFVRGLLKIAKSKGDGDWVEDWKERRPLRGPSASVPWVGSERPYTEAFYSSAMHELTRIANNPDLDKRTKEAMADFFVDIIGKAKLVWGSSLDESIYELAVKGLLSMDEIPLRHLDDLLALKQQWHEKTVRQTGSDDISVEIGNLRDQRKNLEDLTRDRSRFKEFKSPGERLQFGLVNPTSPFFFNPNMILWMLENRANQPCFGAQPGANSLHK